MKSADNSFDKHRECGHADPLHKQATTTPKVRAAFQASPKPRLKAPLWSHKLREVRLTDP